MNNISTFNNPAFGSMRAVSVNDEPYFVGKDVATALGYTNTQKAIRDHVDNEDKLTERIVLSGQNREVVFINESGLYSLILSSKLPKAKEFKRWVTAEVLPAIRKTGGYVNDTAQFVDYYFGQLDTNQKHALTMMFDESKRMSNQLKEQAPKVLFANAVETAHTSILVGDLAKIIKQNGTDIGQKRLFDWMRRNGYLIKDGQIVCGVPEMCRIFQRSEPTIRGWCRDGKLPAFHIGDLWFANKADLLNLVRLQK